MKIFIATKNAHKLCELERILIPLGFDVFSIRDLTDDFPDVPETGSTFAENALLKARAGFDFTGVTTVADQKSVV